MEENGTKPLSVFPPLLIYVTLVLGSVTGRFGAILIGLLIWKIGNLSVPKTWQRVWTACLFHPAFGLMLLRSPGWVMTTIFLILQMALWALAKAKASPSLPSTLLLVLLGLGLALMLLRYESWLMLPVIALTLGVLFEQESWGLNPQLSW